MVRFLLQPFRTARGRIFWPLVLLYLVINLIVVANLRHEVIVGYDSGAHMAYVEAVSHGHLPGPKDSNEFFSAPLSYVGPAILRARGFSLNTSVRLGRDLQVIYSLVITFVMLRLCLRVTPNHWARFVALLMLGMLPAYYRTMGLWRAETMLTMFAVIAADVSLSLASGPQQRHAKLKVVALGVLMGLIILTRQWGLMLFPAILLPQALAILTILRGRFPRSAFAQLAAVLAIAFVLGGWFYVSLFVRFGSATAFNRPPQPGPYLLRQPASFYTSFPIRTITRRPIVHELARRLVPQFYSDLWGDYYLIFAVYGQDGRGRLIHGRPLLTRLRSGERIYNNLDFMVRHMARNNVVSIVPTVVSLVGIGYGTFLLARIIVGAIGGVPPSPCTQGEGGGEGTSPSQRTTLSPTLSLSTGRGSEALALAMFTTAILATAAGYLWFLIGYTDGTGDTIKATYMLQVFPFGAILSAAVFDLLLRAGRSSWMYWTMLVAMLAVATHNSPAYFSRYFGLPDPNAPTTAPKIARGPRMPPSRPQLGRRSATTMKKQPATTKPKRPARKKRPAATTTTTTRPATVVPNSPFPATRVESRDP